MGFILQLFVLFIALYFATRIVTNRVVTLREAFMGALITGIIHEICWFIMYFMNPILADGIAILIAVVVLTVLLLKYYDLGIFSVIALVMLTMGILFAIMAFRIAILYIFFVPLPG